MKEIDLSGHSLELWQKDFVFSTNPTKDDFTFSTNPTKDDIKQAKIEGKILVAYSKNPKKCIEFRERLGESAYLIIWLDQSPIKMDDGRELNFKEFFLGPYLEMLKKTDQKQGERL